MFEIDFLPVGKAGKSGDAICMQFTRPDTGAQTVVIIDAGYKGEEGKGDGDALVEHVKTYYGTATVDVAIVTHPDADHIGGMGDVLRGLDVRELWIHDLHAHGGGSLRAADAIADLKGIAADEGTDVYSVWAGARDLGGAITVLGPTQEYYEELVAQQVEEAKALTEASYPTYGLTASGLQQRGGYLLSEEVPFLPREVNPRNNSSIVILLQVDGESMLFCSDAGVPALNRAWDAAVALGVSETPSMVQLAHHGSRRNCSSAWLDRLLGPTGQPAGVREAIVSCVADSPKHPAGRVVNAYARRGCSVVATAGLTICHNSPGFHRPGWGPATPLPPMLEEDD